MQEENLFFHYGAEIPIEEIPLPMAIGDDLMAIFGKDGYIRNTALLSLLSNVT